MTRKSSHRLQRDDIIKSQKRELDDQKITIQFLRIALQAAQAGKHLTVITDAKLPDNQIAVPYSAYEQATHESYIAGFSAYPKELSGLNGAIDNLREITAGINITAMCTNGEATRRTMQKLTGHLMDALKNLQIEIDKLANHPLVEIHYGAVQQSIGQINQLQKHATSYVVKKTDSEQKILQLFVEQNGNAAVKGLYAELDGIAKRGAAQKEVNKEIGRMAAKKRDPGRGKIYTIGLDVLDDLRAIAPYIRTDLHKQCIGKLEKLSHKDKWRELGTYIADVRKANMSIESAE
jgi:hypothetical protein